MHHLVKHIFFEDVQSPRWKRSMATRRRFPLLRGWHALAWALIGGALAVVGVKVMVGLTPHLLVGVGLLLLGVIIAIGADKLS